MQSVRCLQFMIALVLGSLLYHNATYFAVDLHKRLQAVRNSHEAQHAPKRNVFILGDSLSRYVVIAACGRSWKNTTRDWAKGMFPYKKGSSGTLLCSNMDFAPGAKIAHLQLYGSADAGPYLHGHKNDKRDPYTDTPLRICKGLEMYRANEGEPTHVVYGVMNWDLHLHANKTRNSTAEYANLLKEWGETFGRRLDDVNRCKPLRSVLIVHTAPHTKWGSDLMQDLNEVMIRVTAERNTFLIDWDRDMWEGFTAKQQRRIFRDIMHPRVKQSAVFAEQLMKFNETDEMKGVSNGENYLRMVYHHSDEDISL